MTLRKTLSKLLIFITFLFVFSLTSCDLVKRMIMEAQASKAHSEGNLDKAIRLYEELIVLQPKEVSFHWNLAIACIQKKEFTKAAKQIPWLQSHGEEDLATQLKSMIDRAKTNPAGS